LSWREVSKEFGQVVASIYNLYPCCLCKSWINGFKVNADYYCY